MRGAELLVRCLENEGVGYVFGVAGAEATGLADALADSPIELITARREQAAAFMADIYGRLTGRAGVCLAAGAAGALNLMAGLAAAAAGWAPVVAITGQAAPPGPEGPGRSADPVPMGAGFLRWAARVDQAQAVPEIIRRAFHLAQAEWPGVTRVDVPAGVAAAPAGGEPLPISSAGVPEPPSGLLAQARDLVAEARAPAVLAGNGVVRQRAAGALRHLVDRLALPAVLTAAAKGALGCDDPRSRTSLELPTTRPSPLAAADLVLAAGYHPAEYPPRLWNPERDKTIIHLDTVAAEIDPYYPPAVEVVGDLDLALSRLADTAGHPALKVRPSRAVDLPPAPAGAAPPILRDLTAALRRAMDRDDMLIADAGPATIEVVHGFPAYEPNTVLISTGSAARGAAVPGAIAAKLVRPQQRVVAVVDAGGLLMTVPELETAVRLKAPVVIVLVNDRCRGSSGPAGGADWAAPDFLQLAGSFGVRGARVEAIDAIDPILRAGLDGDTSMLIEVPVEFPGAPERSGPDLLATGHGWPR